MKHIQCIYWGKKKKKDAPVPKKMSLSKLRPVNERDFINMDFLAQRFGPGFFAKFEAGYSALY
jgi:hypothetical protein